MPRDGSYGSYEAQRNRPGRSQLGPRGLVHRRPNALGAGVRERSVESKMTVRGRGLQVGIVCRWGAASMRGHRISGGGGQDRNAPRTTVVWPKLVHGRDIRHCNGSVLECG